MVIQRNDIFLVEQIDRLIRFSNSDWMTLKKQADRITRTADCQS
jgi:DNA invertase Pin-like site-specific DNA recombinase